VVIMGESRIHPTSITRLPALQWNAIPTPFVFFTGKGGVGKTSVAAAVSVALADSGRHVLLMSTDPASNLDDVFGTAVRPEPTRVPGVTGLEVMTLDPEAAAAAYRQRVIDPYRGTVSTQELRDIEEQLAGECTVEVATFDRFTQMLARPQLTQHYDHIVFDTAPTGHTLRLLNLPSAWSEYIQTNQGQASCLGPRSGLQAQRVQYQSAVRQLADPLRTTLVLVSRPETAALREAARAGNELEAEGIDNQRLVVNGVLTNPAPDDAIAQALAQRQQSALDDLPAALRKIPVAAVPLTGLDLTGVDALRALIDGRREPQPVSVSDVDDERVWPGLDALVDDLAAGAPGAVLVMGKGGVGKTTIAAALAVGLAHRGHDVHLSTTDPAGRLTDVLLDDAPEHLTVSRIDPAAELARYTGERLRAAERLHPERVALLAEDLRSPCTEELAVFRAFSGLLNQARRQFVIVDTAPSGHTLRLLDLTGSYHRQVMRGADETARRRTTTPMMRLQDSKTRIIVVALPEVTPVSEAKLLQDDLRRAGIEPYGWVINASLTGSGTQDPILRARAVLERRQLRRVREELTSRAWLVPWQVQTLVGEQRLAALTHA
jgi:arsenite/tail-anchored protein-transporting ATPase